MLKKGSVPALDFRNALPSPHLKHVKLPSAVSSSTGGSRGARSSSARPQSPATSDASIVHEPPAEVAFISSLKQWQEIDATDYEGKWFQAFVVWRNEHHIRVHFMGWQKQWCENISIIESYRRLRPRNADTKVGPGGPQTVKDIMALYRNPKDLNPYVYFATIDARDKEGVWYQAYVVPPAGTDAPGVRVHFSGWGISYDETIPSHELSTRIRPRRTSTLCGPDGLESETKVRDTYNNRRPSKQVHEKILIAGSVKSSRIGTPHAAAKPVKGRPFQIAQAHSQKAAEIASQLASSHKLNNQGEVGVGEKRLQEQLMQFICKFHEVSDKKGTFLCNLCKGSFKAFQYNKHAAFHSTQLSRLPSSSLENLALCLANRQLPEDFPPVDFSTHLVKTEPPLPLANLEVKLDSCPPGSRVPVTVSALSSQIPSSAQPSATSSGSQKRQRSGAQAAVAQSTVDNSDPFVCEFIGTEKCWSVVHEFAFAVVWDDDKLLVQNGVLRCTICLGEFRHFKCKEHAAFHRVNELKKPSKIPHVIHGFPKSNKESSAKPPATNPTHALQTRSNTNYKEAIVADIPHVKKRKVDHSNLQKDHEMREAEKTCESLQKDDAKLEEVVTRAAFAQPPPATSLGFRVFSTMANSRMKCGNADQSSTAGNLAAEAEGGRDEGQSFHFFDGQKANSPRQEADHHEYEEGEDLEGNDGGEAGFDNSDDEEYSIESEGVEDDFDVGYSEDDDNDIINAVAAPEVLVPIKPKPQIGLYIPVISPTKVESQLSSRLSSRAPPT